MTLSQIDNRFRFISDWIITDKRSNIKRHNKKNGKNNLAHG